MLLPTLLEDVTSGTHAQRLPHVQHRIAAARALGLDRQDIIQDVALKDKLHALILVVRKIPGSVETVQVRSLKT